MGYIMMNVFCVNCKQMIESQEHILWYFMFAKKFWEGVLDWWGVENKLRVYTGFNLWSWLSWFKDQSVKIGWGVSIAAALQSLWLNMNRGI